jgi:hypothetical protein
LTVHFKIIGKKGLGGGGGLRNIQTRVRIDDVDVPGDGIEEKALFCKQAVTMPKKSAALRIENTTCAEYSYVIIIVYI